MEEQNKSRVGKEIAMRCGNKWCVFVNLTTENYWMYTFSPSISSMCEEIFPIQIATTSSTITLSMS